MVRVMHDGLQALIMDMLVRPEYQRKGIGTIMMERVLRYLDGFASDGGIFVNLMALDGIDGFYEKFGFQRHPRDTYGSGMTCYLVK